MDMPWSQQKAFAGVLLVAALFVQVSAWDERDLAELRQEAVKARERAVRYMVAHSDYRESLKSSTHCRTPVAGERLVMQLANVKDPSAGFRCEYLAHAKGWGGDVKTTTWSGSGEVLVSREIGGPR